jgi:acyl-CoA thioester hydrolase
MQEPKPNNAQLLHTCEFPLRWGDMDQLGHVNNTVYFRAFEEARTQWIDLFPAELNPGNDAYVVIIHTEATFLKELKAPGTAVVKVFAGAIGRSSMVHHYELYRSDDDHTLYCTGTAKVVWVDPQTGRSTAIPPRYLPQG